jgi:hypothetical protein
MDDPRRLRELAAWLREFAERAGSPWIWEARLIRAQTLEDEAGRLENALRQCGFSGPLERSHQGEPR